MNENINLCEILKGHEGETFYSPIYGNMVLIKVDDRYPYPLYFDTNINNKSVQTFNSDGKPDIFCAECLVFPSKDQRDWNEWLEEQKPKVPKTYSELIKTKEYNNYRLHYRKPNDEDYYTSEGVTPIEKSALTLLKIHQLIEVGYGGNITKEEWNSNNTKYCIDCCVNNITFCIMGFESYKSHIAFHTKEQAEEFLKYSENIKLLKDYFLI